MHRRIALLFLLQARIRYQRRQAVVALAARGTVLLVPLWAWFIGVHCTALHHLHK
jgi:hypothetical protein